jgi:MOSC domain-containing protein
VGVSGRVAWISRCPVKGLAIRQLDECDLTEAGVAGDREFFLVDEDDRLVNSKGLGVLQQIVPTYDDEGQSLTLDLPDGTTVSQQLGFDGSLSADFWGHRVDVRVVNGPWSEAISSLAGQDLRLVRAQGPAPDRLRSGAATLLGTASLRAMARNLGVHDVDGRRFRMNFGVDGLREHQEDEWLGQRVRLGEAVVVPLGNVGRCAVTTQNPDTGAPDLDTLKVLAAYRGSVESTEPLPFGVHAAVVEAGRVRVGDAVKPE